MSALQRLIDDESSQSVQRSSTTQPHGIAENGTRSIDQRAHQSCAHHLRDSISKDSAQKFSLPSTAISSQSTARPEDAPHDEEQNGVEHLLGSANISNSIAPQTTTSEYRFVSVGGSLIPPINFGIVEEDLYRSGMPNELNFPFLERLQLRTIIYLASDEVSEKLHDFIDDQDIQLLHLFQDDDIPTPWKPISEETVLSAMELLLSTSTYPVYIMCSQGRHRTGTVVGCLRKLQRWSLSSIFEEYNRHADGKGRLVNEQFIELFDTDLINLPSVNRPKWLR